MVIRRFEIYLVNFDPAVGSEMRKTRPCLVVSPNSMHDYIRTVIVAPLTSKGKLYPSRVPCHFQGQDGRIALDQIRTVDKSRMLKRLGKISSTAQHAVLESLAAIFAP